MNREDILEALEIVKPGLASKEHIEQSTCFAFKDGKVLTFNDEISVSHPVEGLNGLEGAIKADEFYQVLCKMKTNDVEIEANGSEVRLKAGKAKAGLTLQEKIKMPLEAIGEKSKWKKVPEELMKALKFVSFACSTDMSRPIITCVNVTENGSIEASDSYRIMTYKLVEKMPVSTFLLPASTVKRLNGCNPTHIAEGHGWIHFKTEKGTEYSCRTFFGDTFPDVSKYMNVHGEDFELPKVIEEVLDRASIFSNEVESNVVTITIKPKRMIVRGQSDVGWFEEEMNLKYKGEEKKFTIRPELLKDVSKMLKKCILGENALKFIGDNWEYVGVLKMKG